MMRAPEFEWTFSTRVRERKCHHCRVMTSSFLTNLRTGVRKPLCSTCFFDAVKVVRPNDAPRNYTPRKQPDSVPPARGREEQLRLC
jgi:tRNA(His) 5'-end guanylyltransferase